MYKKVRGERKSWMEKWIREEVGRRRCSADEANGYSQHRGCRQGNSWWGEERKTQRRQKDRRQQRGGEEDGRKDEHGSKLGRKMEFLWVSRQRERGLQHGWVEDTGKGEGKRESPGRASTAREGLGDVQQEKRFSFTCSLRVREEPGWGQQCATGAAGLTGTGSWLGTGSGQRPPEGAKAAQLQSPWDACSQHAPPSMGPAIPLGTSTAELEEGAARAPLLTPTLWAVRPHPVPGFIKPKFHSGKKPTVFV